MFSLSKNVVSHHRQRFRPRTLETLMYLKCNRRFWDVDAVQEALDFHLPDDGDYHDVGGLGVGDDKIINHAGDIDGVAGPEMADDALDISLFYEQDESH